MRRTAEILQYLRDVDTKLARLDAAIITRYPDSERAADNYEALRKALIAGGLAGSRHVSDLITLATAIDEGASPETTRLKIADLLQVLDVTEIKVSDASQVPEHRIRDFFEIVGEQAHPRSAWVRMQDGVVSPIRKGYLTDLPYPSVSPLSAESSEDSTQPSGSGQAGVPTVEEEPFSQNEPDVSPEPETPIPTDTER